MERRALKARAGALAAQIARHELACEENNGLPDDVLAELRGAVLASGLAAVNMPAEWGGAGLSILEQVLVQEELGGLTGALWDVVWRPANALRACTPAQRERYLLPAIRGERRDCFAVTEPGAGSDPRAIETAAERVEGGWRISGEKWFVTVGDVADFLIVLAAAGRERAPTLFLVDRDTPGVRVVRTPRYMHTFVFEHPEFAFDGVEVSDDAVLGAVGQGYELTRDWFVEERLMIAARATGAAERALREAAGWARGREQFGRPIAEHQLVGAMLADSAVDIALIRGLAYQVAEEADAGADRKTLHARAAMAKLAASEAAGRVVDRAVQVLGGRGYMREQPVERLYRELRVDRIWEGTSEIQRLAIANEINKRGCDGVLGGALEFSAAMEPGVMRDVLVLGAGLAGLSAARDLAAAGADVEVLEARDRPGGRVEQAVLDDGRVVQLGGEVVGAFHSAYLGLAAELGLETRPSYVAEPGEMSWDLAEGPAQGEWPPFFTPADVADAHRIEGACVRLARSVDPADPWSHPEAAALDRLSFADWLRAEDARPAVVRLHELGALALAAGSSERWSLLAMLRIVSTAGGDEIYGYEHWEGLRLAAGSAALPLRLAADLGGRLRLGACVRALDVTARGVRVTLDDGEELAAEAVVCALPVGPLRDIAVSGVSEHPPGQPAPPAPGARRQGGRRLPEADLARGGRERAVGRRGARLVDLAAGLRRALDADRPRAPRALPRRAARGAPRRGARAGRGAVRRRRAAPRRVPDPRLGRRPVHPGLRRAVGAGRPARRRAAARHARAAVLRRGSDHWVAGYMEGAVRTGRAAAAAALGVATASRAV